MTTDRLRDEIHKRFTLNWLIQGAAQHAGMTFHHLVRDQLDAVDGRLMPLYDLYALSNQLQRWHITAIQAYGSPEDFWQRARASAGHPFYGHPLLPAHGGELAEEAHRRALDRSRQKGLATAAEEFMASVAGIRRQLLDAERPHAPALVELAKRTTADIWGIPPAQLCASLGPPVPFGTPIRILTPAAARFASRVAGLGGVERRGDELVVVGMGKNWHLLTKELVKGTAELICMHGARSLSDAEYRDVTDAADRIDYERWMLQSGGELWRRLLAAAPGGRPIAELLMHIARLPPTPLHSLVGSIIERPALAREILATLGIGRDDASARGAV
jgi:hypothetical protein